MVTSRKIKQCWVCNKRKKKYMSSHHVVGFEEEPDLTVDACRGCHMLVTWLARVKFLADPKAVGRLLTLARLRAGLPDARTVVAYEESSENKKPEGIQ